MKLLIIALVVIAYVSFIVWVVSDAQMVDNEGNIIDKEIIRMDKIYH